MKDEDILAFGPWNDDKIKINFNNRIQHLNETTKKSIDTTWTKYHNIHTHSYDGTLLRLNKWETNKDILQLHLETTCFSHYIGTRNPNFTDLFQEDERANPLGLTIIPITIDQNIVISKRAASMEQNPNKLYFFGGHAEPPKSLDATINLKEESLREIVEELGIKDILYFTFIGLAYDPLFCHPELFSIAIVNTSKDDLLIQWAKAKDKHETDDIFFLPLDNIINGNNCFNYDPTWSYSIGLRFFNKSIQNRILNFFSTPLNNARTPYEFHPS